MWTSERVPWHIPAKTGSTAPAVLLENEISETDHVTTAVGTAALLQLQLKKISFDWFFRGCVLHSLDLKTVKYCSQSLNNLDIFVTLSLPPWYLLLIPLCAVYKIMYLTTVILVLYFYRITPLQGIKYASLTYDPPTNLWHSDSRWGTLPKVFHLQGKLGHASSLE